MQRLALILVLCAASAACARTALRDYTDGGDVVVNRDGPIGPDGPGPIDVPIPPDVPVPARCRSNADCAAPTPVCDTALGVCVGCTTSPDSCPTGQRCDPVQQRCVPGCRTDMDCRGATPRCREDVHQCVACVGDGDCGPGAACIDFACVARCGSGAACPAGQECCAGLCADLRTDPLHCGSCTTACSPLAHAQTACLGRGCGIGRCDPGFADCNGRAADGCETDLGADAANCGGCGRACPAGLRCSGGACVGGCNGGGACAAGQQCCMDGCDNTQSDVRNCGGCGFDCSFEAHATPTCTAGACTIGACAPGYADCDRVVMNGCEAELATDATSCGACGNACARGQTCTGGRCVGGCGAAGTCAPGLSCCMSACADLGNDPNNCGGCGVRCDGFANGSGTCSRATCVLTACNTGFADCNASGADGCETNTNTDARNCGGCGHACGAGQSCTGGVCVGGGCRSTGCPRGLTCCGDTCIDITSSLANCGGCFTPCPADFNVCMGGACCQTGDGGTGVCGAMGCPDGQTVCNGTCVDYRTDRANCGGCRFACATGQRCVNSMCVGGMGCNGGPACTGAQTCCASGCANTTTDARNCGGCGRACAPGQTCVGGTCSGCACATGLVCCTGNVCANTTTDVNNCGMCGTVCPARPNATATCTMGTCGLGACLPGFADCDGMTANGCEVSTTTDANNCGGCGRVCPMGQTCVGGACSGTTTDTFEPMVNPTYLSPGVHRYTSVHIPAGVTVYVAGMGPSAGTLELYATGDIVVDGTIDVSGGPGTQNTITSRSTQRGRAGGGGYTGERLSAPFSEACQFVGGNGGLNGPELAGTAGTCTVASSTTCLTTMDPTSLIFAAAPARFGGGAGVFTGYRAYGSGGGGIAGGAPGALGAAYMGEMDCSGASGGGGATGGRGGRGGSMLYDGSDGTLGQTECAGVQPGVPAAYVGGGGGGSIGADAVSDLAVVRTFRPGSGGGGGSADYLNRPVFGGTSGGGGGGGALRLVSTTRIQINGRVLANGGEGGDAFIGNGMAAGCDPQPGAGGGGGSGGVVFLQAPSLTVASGAMVSARGGAGGQGSAFATGGEGGGGGLGRIRVSATTATCALRGSFTPALSSGCTPTATPTAGTTYVGVYPN